jgi:hypothetical protein
MTHLITPRFLRAIQDSFLNYMLVDPCVVVVSYLHLEDRIFAEVLSKNCIVIELGQENCNRIFTHTPLTLKLVPNGSTPVLEMSLLPSRRPSSAWFRKVDYSNELSLVHLLEELEHEGLCRCRVRRLRKIIETDEKLLINLIHEVPKGHQGTRCIKSFCKQKISKLFSFQGCYIISHGQNFYFNNSWEKVTNRPENNNPFP